MLPLQHFNQAQLNKYSFKSKILYMNRHFFLTNQYNLPSSNQNLHQLISDSLERIRHSSTVDDIKSIVLSVMEILKTSKRDDLCAHFTDQLRGTMTEWQAKQENASISTLRLVVDDNLIEENMDVDDDQDDRHRKQIITSSTSNLSNDFSDVDYRFLNQDVNHSATTTVQDSGHRKQRRKSRFSDRLPTDDNQAIQVKSIASISKTFSKEVKKYTVVNVDFRIDNAKVESSKLTDVSD